MQNSFTLVETLISLILVSIIVSSFTKLITKSDDETIYQQLVTIDNQFNFNHTILYNSNIKFNF